MAYPASLMDENLGYTQSNPLPAQKMNENTGNFNESTGNHLLSPKWVKVQLSYQPT